MSSDDSASAEWGVEAPLRIDIAGSWCDCPQYTDRWADAATLSLAVRPGCWCEVGTGSDGAEPRIRLPRDLPMGSGLGASGASAVAHVAAQRFGRAPIPEDPGTRADIAEAAYARERALTGRLTGRQDHYAAAFGGLRLYRWGLTSGSPAVDACAWVGSAGTTQWLVERLTVLRTGRTRDSSAIHADVFRDTVGAAASHLRALARGAVEAAAAIEREDEQALGGLVDEQRMLVERLSTAATVPELSRLVDVVGSGTVLASKALGAGGGGCVVVVHRAGQSHDVAAAVAAALGWDAWSFEPAPGGVGPAAASSQGAAR